MLLLIKLPGALRAASACHRATSFAFLLLTLYKTALPTRTTTTTTTTMYTNENQNDSPYFRCAMEFLEEMGVKPEDYLTPQELTFKIETEDDFMAWMEMLDRETERREQAKEKRKRKREEDGNGQSEDTPADDCRTKKEPSTRPERSRTNEATTNMAKKRRRKEFKFYHYR